ncbi:TonB-dependent receptor [candidate division KSB1 bacterium]|nr:TonB-dependent receptor [candidate division KSB1 bacterium]
MKRLYILMLALLISVFSAATVWGQGAALEIEGTVTEELTGDPLPGANVALKGTNLGTATDANGVFSLRLPNFTEATLVASFIGYKTREITVTESTQNLNIVLEEDVLKVSEVVVTGLATSVKRRNLAHSVGTVSSKELIPAPTQTLERALSGKIAGVRISQNTGAPGGGIFVNLRGTSTLRGATEPLLVVDGVIISNAAIQSGIDIITEAPSQGNPSAQGQPTNRIADLNPNDIENIEILKGPSAAAIYGSKASNGVIIISTKQGIPGKTSIDVTQQIGFNSILKKLGTRRFAGDLFVDYEDELYGEKGLLAETTLSVRGGSERTQFYVGGLFQDEDGIIKNTEYKKYSGKVNVNHKISDRLRVSAFTLFSRTESDRGVTGNENAGGVSFGFTLAFLPSNVDLRPRPDGSYPPPPGFPLSNPLQTRDLLVNNEVVYRTIGSLKLDWNIVRTQTQNLDFILQTGADFFSMENEVISPPELFFEQIRGADAGRSIAGETESTLSNLYLHLNYSYTTPSNLFFRTSAGFQFENRNRNNVLVSSLGLLSTQTNVDQASSSSVQQAKEIQRERGFFVQEEIDLNENIFLTAGLRGDASSANGNTDKFFLFPKASASIRLSQYPFWQGLTSFVPEFKLRAAYGETGNLPPPTAKFTSLDQANIGGLGGVIQPQLVGAEDIKPERSKEIEVGFDATFFNENALLEFSYYRQNIKDLILVAEIPGSSGSTQKIDNLGEMRTQGVEVSLGVNPIRKKNLNWTSRVNFFTFDSEITELEVPRFFVSGFGLGLGQFLIQEGKSPHTIVAQVDEVGNFEEFGNETPDFQISFNNTLSFLGNVELSFLWDWRKGGEVINLGRLLTDLGGTTEDLDTPEGQERVAAATGLGFLSGIPYVESGTYLKLRELSLSYSLPPSVVSNISRGQLSYIRFGLAARNLIMITDYEGYDPEVGQFGNIAVGRAVDVIPFPSSRSFYFNVALGL